MFFLIRCIFWLGLVFSHIAGLEGVTAASLAHDAAQGAGEHASSLGRMAMDAASRKCAADPAVCLAMAKKASLLTAKTAGDSRDTLRAADRAPAWRPRIKAGGDQS